MSDPTGTCPMSREQVIDTYFMEHRAKLIDIAAYLDRLDRTSRAADDIRETSFRQCLEILADGESRRAARILSLLSDHTTALPQSADGLKGASGAPVSLVTEDSA